MGVDLVSDGRVSQGTPVKCVCGYVSVSVDVDIFVFGIMQT